MRDRYKLSSRQWDAINAAEAEVRQERALGHLYKLTVQHRYGESKAIESDLQVWVSCTCGRWMAGRWFPSKDEALAAFNQHVGAA
jgi:hypothetical protein